MTPRADLGEAAADFAAELQAVINGVLPVVCQVTAEEKQGRYVVRPSMLGRDDQPIPLSVAGTVVAGLDVVFRCRLDHRGSFLAVEESQFRLLWGEVGEPLLRLHFRRNSTAGRPAAHWHVHAERGAFSALLHRAGMENAHNLGSLHLPVGGGRMRPALEDFLEFLVRECGIDHRNEYMQHLSAARGIWRRRQLATLVRDAPEEAVRVLQEHGYVVAPPGGGPMIGQPDRLCQY